MSSPASICATSSMSGAASTARQISAPTLPRAPRTPTLQLFTHGPNLASMASAWVAVADS